MPEQLVTESGKSANITGTSQITDFPCRMVGFYVNSTSAGTLVFRDGTGSGVALDGTITPAVGFHPFPVAVTKLHATVANTIDVTVFYTT